MARSSFIATHKHRLQQVLGPNCWATIWDACITHHSASSSPSYLLPAKVSGKTEDGMSPWVFATHVGDTDGVSDP